METGRLQTSPTFCQSQLPLELRLNRPNRRPVRARLRPPPGTQRTNLPFPDCVYLPQLSAPFPLKPPFPAGFPTVFAAYLALVPPWSLQV
jgi:hypothetical protein